MIVICVFVINITSQNYLLIFAPFHILIYTFPQIKSSYFDSISPLVFFFIISQIHKHTCFSFTCIVLYSIQIAEFIFTSFYFYLFLFKAFYLFLSIFLFSCLFSLTSCIFCSIIFMLIMIITLCFFTFWRLIWIRSIL